MLLHLGVLDVPYNQVPSKRQRKARAGTVTTGDVAGWLENRYHIMEIYFEQHKEDVAKSLENSIAGALESFLMGAPVTLDALGPATSEIEDGFKQFLAQGEMEKIGFPGVPTAAALAGINHRFKNPRTGRRRVSFVDTGLFLASFRAWIDG